MRGTAPRRVVIIDETYVDAPPSVLAPIFAHPANVATAWPHVSVTAQRDRGDEGAVWEVVGHLDGEFEVWLEPCWEGTVVHHFVRADAVIGRPRAVERAHVLRWKRFVTAVKDRVEPPRRRWTFRGGESVRSHVEGL